jgi:hypothetical protein
VRFGKLKVDPVYWEYGDFLDNLELSTLTVDANENLYAIEAASFKIYKISEGNKILVDTAKQKPTESRFGPDGNLYMLTNSRKIDKYDLTAGTVTEWTQLPQGRLVKFGDFDEVNLYAGRIANGLLIILSITIQCHLSAITERRTAFIRKCNCICCFKNRLAAGKTGTSGFRRNLKSKSVFDMSTTVLFFQMVTAVIPSSDGNIYHYRQP